MQENKDIVLVFKALADSNRLKILDMLINKETCSCKMELELAIKQSTISHHMQILINAGLVNVKTSGKYSFYSINTENMNKISKYLDKYKNSTKIPCILKSHHIRNFRYLILRLL